ncbi:MAG: tetratricopeptide repeat protein [Myxococcota bacterium]
MSRSVASFAFVLVLAAVPSMAAAPSAKAKAAFDRAENALAANQLDDAVAAYREAIAATLGYAAALNGLGSAYFKQGKREDGIVQFKLAIEADPAFKLAYFNLGYAARKVGDFATAATAYEKYTSLAPDDPDGFYGLGESYKQLNQPQKAIAAYETFLQKEKRPSEQKWIDKAKESITALKTAPSSPPTQPTTVAQPAPGSPPVTSAHPPQPASSATPAPEIAAKRVADGDGLMKEKKYREASFAYQDAANADPNNVEALFKLGNTYAVLGYYAQAIERWNRVSQLTPDPAIKKSAQDNIAKAQSKIAALGGGSPQAQGRGPGSGPVAESTRVQARGYYEQGVRDINARNYAAAISSLSTAIQLEPSLTVAYIARGSAHIGLRRFNEAAADYQYALRLDESMASPLYGLAEAYRAMGRGSEARSYYEKYVASSAPDVRTELQSEARAKAERLR